MVTNLVRGADAPTYDPPGHHGVHAQRLQGLEAGGPTGLWVGRSSYPPGASAELAPTQGDTVYVVLSGRLTVTLPGPEEVVLEASDSLHLPIGTTRAVRNSTEQEATLLVVMRPPLESESPDE